MGCSGSVIIQKCLLATLVLQLGCNVRQCWANTAVDAAMEFGVELPFMATAFVQTGNELHYFSDIEYHETLVSGAPVKSSDENGPVLNNQLQFTPSELQFGEQSMGVPRQQEVRIHNPTASTVRFDAISGSTVHFHCSFPEDKTVNPGDATTFGVVFLPRQEGLIENVLFVHSSLGTFTYSVKGKGKASVYRIRPLVGAKVPVNGTLISPVQLHNPHPTTLRVTEIYTSGGDVHLELPQFSPDTQHQVSLWDIAPFETKTVMNAKLLGAHERNASTYIKIKTDWTRRRISGAQSASEYANHTGGNADVEHVEETLIVPFEVEITKKRGLYSTVDMLDFGLIRAGEKSPELMLEIFSTLEKGIEIETLYVERGEDPNGIYMEFASKPPISIKCGARQQPGAPKAIAKILFDSKVLRGARKNGSNLVRYKGRIVAESRGGIYNITVPYVALVYYGSLTPRAEETAFHSLLQPPVTRSVSLTNELPFDVAIWNITLDAGARKSFKAKLLSNVVTIVAGETKPAIYLRYRKKEKDGYATFFTVHTNVSTFKIPIVIFNGKLKITLYSLNQKEFNFGLMNAGDRRSIQFAITNENPVTIVVKNLRRALPSITTLSLLGIQSGNGSVLHLSNRRRRDWSEIWQEGVDFPLRGQSFAVFKYTLEAPSDRTILQDNLLIETDFEYASYPVTYDVDEGTMISVPEQLVFANAFPGHISSRTLKVFSTFKMDMRVQRISSLSGDREVFFESSDPTNAPIIKAGTLSDLGRVHFIPSANCTDDCYIGMPLHTADGQWFTYGVKLPQNLAEIDSYLYNRLRRKFLALQAEGKNYVNATVVIETDKVKQLEVPLTAELIWPRLLTRTTVHFPLTAVGNFTIVNLTLTNPSSLPVAVQLLPLVIYPDADTLIDFFRMELDSPLTEPIEMNETLMFSLRDTELFTLKPDSPVPKLREQLETVLGTQIPKFTLSMLLQPGMKVRVRVGFLPSDYVLRSSLLLIRNNLTVLEPVVLYGRGARMDMQVEGRAARTRDPLMFEIQPHHLSDCHNPKRLTHKLFTTLTVKRSFTVVNSGEVAFTIVNISINNVACENRGFRILNCHPFRLKPNETHILDVAYTPDFLMSWNEAALQFYMHMNGTSWLFPIGASVPRHMLAKCHAALPRPPFESLMYYSCVSALIFCLICVVACAYLEADRTVTCAIRQQYGQVRRVFDLNAIDRHLTRDDIPPSSEFKPSSPRRHVLHYAEDSNILVRSFWQTANSILWLFSFVWQFRGDETRVPIKPAKVRQTKALVKCLGEAAMYVVKTPVGSVKSLSPPAFDSSCTSSSTTAKRYGHKSSSLSPYSNGHASQNGNSPKSMRVNGEYRATKDKVKVNGTALPSSKTKEGKENNHAGLNRSRSGTATETSSKQPSLPGFSNGYRKKRSLTTGEVEDIGVRGAKRSEQEYVPLSAAAVQTTPTIEKRNDWLSVDPEKVPDDERSEAGLSDTSGTPEWADGPVITNDADVDDEFSALAEASERLFEPELKLHPAQRVSPTSRPPPVTIVRPIQSQQKRNLRKKQETVTRNSLEKRGLGQQDVLSFGPVGLRRNDGKSDNGRPSAFIEQLQKERRLAEDQYLRNKMLREERDEVWPGFNLRLPTLSENLWDRDYDTTRMNESIWQLPQLSPASNNWPPPPLPTPGSNNLVQQHQHQSNTDSVHSYLAEAVRAFRLNPEAPPFVIENPSTLRTQPLQPMTEPLSPVQQNSTLTPTFSHSGVDSFHETVHNDTYIDDPLGLSGSLFGRGATNIWASDPRPASRANNNTDTNSAAVYWAEKFLADEDNEEK